MLLDAEREDLTVAVLSQPIELERFFLTVPDDTEDAPWMVMADLREELRRLRAGQELTNRAHSCGSIIVGDASPRTEFHASD